MIAESFSWLLKRSRGFLSGYIITPIEVFIMAKKVNLKSVRLSDEVLSYVENFEGNGFNQKFENLVLFCMKEEKNKRAYLEDLDQLISLKWKKLQVMDDFFRDLVLTQQGLEDVRHDLKHLREYLQQLNDSEF
nr:hypothetical protein [uncultured Blautia sp.]